MHLPTHVNCRQPTTPKITEETNLILYQIQITCNSGLSIVEMLHATYAQNAALYTLHASKWWLSIAVHVFGILSKTAHILRQTGRIISSKSIPEYRMRLNAQLQINIKSQISCTMLESCIMFNSFNIISNSIRTTLHVIRSFIHSPLLLEKALACIPLRDVVAA